MTRHFCASVFIINPVTKKILLVHHKKFNKWVQPGGHIEENETIEQCIIREVKEETGLDLLDYKLCGEVLFDIDGFIEIMYVFTSTNFKGELIECNEGTLECINKSEIKKLNLWEGDLIIFDKMTIDKYFKLKMIYRNNHLLSYEEYL